MVLLLLKMKIDKNLLNNETIILLNLAEYSQARSQTKILTEAERRHFGFFIYNFFQHTETLSANANNERSSRTNSDKRDGIETATSLGVH